MSVASFNKGDFEECSSHDIQACRTNTQQPSNLFDFEGLGPTARVPNVHTLTTPPGTPPSFGMQAEATFACQGEQSNEASANENLQSEDIDSDKMHICGTEDGMQRAFTPIENCFGAAPYLAPILGCRGEHVLKDLLDNLLKLRAQGPVIAEVLGKLVKEYMDLGSAWDEARTNVDEGQARFWGDIHLDDEDAISLKDTDIFFGTSRLRWQRLQQLEELMAWKRVGLEKLISEARNIEGFGRLGMGNENAP